MSATLLTTEVTEGVAEVTLDRPPVNAFDLEQAERLDEAVAQLERDNEIRVVVFRGAGGRFSAGADIKMILGFLGEADRSQRLTAFAGRLQEVFARIERLPLPTIAAIEGPATGGGLELALACDIRVAGVSSKIGLPEAKLGLLPGAGGTQRLTRLAGEGVALQLILTGNLVAGKQAQDLGLVQLVVSDQAVSDSARDLAQSIAENPAPAVAAVKRCVRLAPNGFAAELDATRALAGTPETAAAAAAFFRPSVRR